MSTTDELIAHAARYAEGYDGRALPHLPAKRVAVLACMDARLDVTALLGLRDGDAHVIRNAGGVVTADGLRSLAISQRKLGTTEIVLIHHTRCGLLTFTDDEFAASVEADTGVRPLWSAGTFADLDRDVLQGIARVRAEPAIPHQESVRGFVYDVDLGTLREVVAASTAAAATAPAEGALFAARGPHAVLETVGSVI